jgi:hypothetical protein
MPAHDPSTEPDRTPVSTRHAYASATEAAQADEVIRLFLHLRDAAGYDEPTARARAIYIYSGTHLPGPAATGAAFESPAAAAETEGPTL